MLYCYFLFQKMGFLPFFLFIGLLHSIQAQVDLYNTNTVNNDTLNNNQIYGNGYNQNSNYNPNYNTFNNNLDPNRNYNSNNMNYNPSTNNQNYNQNFGSYQGSYGNIEELRCPEYWVQFQSSCYRFIKSPLKPYNEARRICQVNKYSILKFLCIFH